MAKRLQVLGPGCARCEAMKKNVEEAARRKGLDCEIEKVSDINVITGMGVMTTPALVVDGEVKFQGRVPRKDEIKGYLK